MRIHILSDLHTEFMPFVPTVQDADVVILAGDIGIKTRGVEWAKTAFRCPVLYVPGNHEYYGGHLTRTLRKLVAASNDQVQVLDCEAVVLGGVRFLGATGNAPLAAWDAQRSMTDFRKIRTKNDFRKVQPADFAELSRAAKRWLQERLAEPFAGPTVVITHHAPSMVSLADVPDAGSHLDAAYANRWENLMGGNLVLWVHGHSHRAVDYKIAGTRVISNPRGYPAEETGFDENFVVELSMAVDNDAVA